MTARVGKNIYPISVALPGSPLKSTNCYVIKGEGLGRNLLIDTGFALEECRLDLMSGLSALDIDMENTDIFLTHLHADHAGLAAELAGNTSELFISEPDGDHLLYRHGRTFDSACVEQFRINGFSAEEIALEDEGPMHLFSDVPFTRYTPLRDGDILRYGGHVLQAVSTPGHTPGHMCLYEAAEKTMFLGDHVLFDITPNIVTWPGVANSLKSYLESLEKIRSFNVAIPLPGHREVGCSMNERIDSIVSHHRRRLDEALAILRRQDGLTAYEIAGCMRWKIRALDWADFPLRQKWFAVGEANAHLDYLVAQGLLAEEARDDGVLLYHALN